MTHGTMLPFLLTLNRNERKKVHLIVHSSVKEQVTIVPAVTSMKSVTTLTQRKGVTLSRSQRLPQD